MTEKYTRKKEKKVLDSTTKTLLIVFIVLIGLVTFLGIEVLLKEKESKEKVFANLVIPVIKKEATQNFSINADSLVNDGEYILKVTNYREDVINDEEIIYSITVDNKTKIKISVTKDYSDDNLLEENNVISNLKIRGKVKQDTYYHIKAISKEGLKKNDKINVRIES